MLIILYFAFALALELRLIRSYRITVGHKSTLVSQKFYHSFTLHGIKNGVPILFADIGSSNYTASDVERSDLRDFSSNELPHILVSSIYRFGVLNQKKKSAAFLPKKDATAILMTLDGYSFQSPVIDCDVAGVLVGLVKMGVYWSDMCSFSPKFISSLPSEISKIDNEHNLGTIIWALATMGADLKALSHHMQSAIVSGFEAKCDTFSAFSHTSSLWAFAKMGFKWFHFSDESSVRILRKNNEYAFIVSSAQASKVIWALGTMCYPINRLPPDLVKRYIASIAKARNPLSTAMLLTGLAKLGDMSWSMLTMSSKVLIAEQVEILCSPANGILPSQQGQKAVIAQVIWALGTLDAPVRDFSPTCQSQIFNRVTCELSNCQPWTFCNVLWGLAKMALEWADLPFSLQNSIQMNFVRLAPTMKSTDVGILSWSLGSLAAPVDTFPEYVLTAFYQAILDHIETMNSPELSRLLWGLSGTGVRWGDLPPTLKWNINTALRRLGKDMVQQDIANCAYAFALLAFDAEDIYDVAYRRAHESLLEVIRRIVSMKLNGTKTESLKAISMPMNNDVSSESDYSPSTELYRGSFRVANKKGGSAFHLQETEQLRIFANYLLSFGRVSDLRSIPQVLLRPDPSSQQSQSVGKQSSSLNPESTSRLQNTILTALDDAFALPEYNREFEVVSELSSFNGILPIDAGVIRRGKLVALLEVDGPHHYRFDGTLRRIDKLKEALYKVAHPDCLFYRIRWDEASKFGSEAIADDLAAMIRIHSQSINPITSAYRSTERAFAEFFSWGLKNSDDSDRN